MSSTQKDDRGTNETIDRLLTGLSQVGPPLGIERRITDALESHARRDARESHAPWRTRVLAGALAACAVATGIVLIPRPPAPHPRPRSAQALLRPARTDSTGSGAKLSATSGPNHSRTRARSRLNPIPRRATANEMGTESRPAPQAPLTQQEQLLLQVAASGDAKRTELLNPELQQKQQMEAKAEFDRFFQTRNTGDSE